MIQQTGGVGRSIGNDLGAVWIAALIAVISVNIIVGNQV